MASMAQVKFATTLPEYALEILRERARHDGMALGDWLARAIYDKATRDGVHDTAARRDAARTRFIDDTEAERLRRFHRAESE